MDKLTRKDFLKRAGLFGLGAMSAAALLQACGGGEESSSEASNGAQGPMKSPPKATSKPDPKPAVAEAPANDGAADCSKLNAGLTDQDKTVRDAVGYMDQSTEADKNCTNCRFWQPDKFDGPCGGCQLFANGAVNPAGYCKSWAAPV